MVNYINYFRLMAVYPTMTCLTTYLSHRKATPKHLSQLTSCWHSCCRRWRARWVGLRRRGRQSRWWLPISRLSHSNWLEKWDSWLQYKANHLNQWYTFQHKNQNFSVKTRSDQYQLWLKSQWLNNDTKATPKIYTWSMSKHSQLLFYKSRKPSQIILKWHNNITMYFLPQYTVRQYNWYCFSCCYYDNVQGVPEMFP